MSVQLSYRMLGQGEPVIILHGLFGSKRNWSTIAGQLADTCKVITVDLRNHGDSGHADSMTYTDMASDVLAVMRECRLDKASLIGHSMGGKVAMACTLLEPSRIASLMVLDVAPVAYDHQFEPLLNALAGLPLDNVLSRQQADRYLQKEIPDVLLRQFLLQNLVYNGSSYHWRINLPAINANLTHLTGFPALDFSQTYAGPSLFLRGEYSDYILPEHSSVIRTYFPQALIDTVDDAGHWLHAEQPGIVTNRIHSFLEKTYV
ncbi:MAG: alpha/beta fold hydrolase [Gammaproteobacteria bacterium]